jgi:drug/metabolite transporter (DMT)-like permease
MATKLTVWQMAAGATILCGVAVALAPGKHLNLTRRTFGLGIIFSLLAAFGNGMGAVISRKAYAVAFASKENIDAATAGFQRLIGGLFVAAVCLAVVKRREIAAQFTHPDPPRMPEAEKWRRVWPWVLANSFAGQTLGVTCYQWALKTTPTGLVLAIVAMTPLVVIPFAKVLEGEAMEPRSIIGGVLAVAGAIWLVMAR